MANVQQNYLAAGTYTFVAPADVTTVVFAGISGGGAGGSQSGAAGKSGGGGGGAFVEDIITVTPGTAYTITVGAGGTVGATTGGQGGSTSFGATSVAGGGFGGGTGSSGVGGGAGAGGTVSAGGGTGNFAGGAGATGSALTGASGFGGGGGSSGNNGHAGNSAQSPSNTAAQGGATTAGSSPLASGGPGGVGSGTPQSTPSSTPGTTPGGGGGGAFRSSTGSQSGSAGASGQAVLTFNTNDPYIVQSSTVSAGSSPYTFALTAVTTGNTVLFAGSANGGTISAATLGGVAGTIVPGNPGTPDVVVYKWENVTGSPTALVVTGSGNIWGAALEIGNPGTVTNGQTVANNTTSVTLTPAHPVAGQLQIVAAYLNGSNFGSTTAAPGTPWTLLLGGTGSTKAPQVYYYSQPNTTASAVSWTVSTGNNGVLLVSVNPKASRSAFLFGNE